MTWPGGKNKSRSLAALVMTAVNDGKKSRSLAALVMTAVNDRKKSRSLAALVMTAVNDGKKSRSLAALVMTASTLVMTASTLVMTASTLVMTVFAAACAGRSPSSAGALAPAVADKLYITNQGSASITVVDQTTLSVDTLIDLTTLGFSANAKPHHAVVEPDGSFWYATLIGDGKVLKFDRANRLVAQVSMETPGLLALDPVHDSLFVGRSMTAVNPPKSLGVIKRSSFALVDEQEIQIPRPHALVVTRDGKWVHAASLAENRIASLETSTGRVTLSTLPGANTRSMVQFTLSPDGRRLVVGGEVSNTVIVFDLAARPAPLAPSGEFAVNGKPWDPVFSPDGARAYFSLFADSAVAEVDLAGQRVTRTFRGGLSQPYDMIMRRDGKYLFVVNQNLTPVKPGQSAHDNMPGMAGSPPSGPARGWLSIIDVASGKVIKTLMLGAGPTGMGGAGAR